MTTPTIEPDLLYTGDTWAWERNLADYPASAGWTLNYVLMNSTHRIPASSGTIAGSASGDTHLISVAAATTATYTAGTYTWQAFVTKASERHTVGQGTVVLKAGLAGATAAADQRSQAQVALDAAVAALATYTATNGRVAEYEIAGRRMKFRSMAEIRQLIGFWRIEVQRELDAENIRRGLSTSRKVFVRFGQ